IGAGGREAGDPVEGSVLIRIAPEWHINSWKPDDDFSIPTVVEIESPGMAIESIDYPPHIERAFSFAGGEVLAVYEGAIAVAFRGVREMPGSITLTARVKYQACNDKVCLPPRTETAAVEIGADGVATIVDSTPGSGGSGDFTLLSEAPPAESRPALFGSDLGTTLESRGLALTLIVVFVLGLALNLTPCVYPLIPLTIAYFTSQTGGSRGRRVGLASCFVLGLAAMYSALGVFSALSGALFGAWLQLPAVLIFFALLMLVLASSMFGLFEIQVPHFISDRAGARSGYAGAATMGLLAGIVAAPCVGPFIISLIALVSQRASVPFGFLLFFVLALGLGFPYLLLGIFSTGLSSIPRAGLWMVQIKQALGFVLIAMAFYFLRPIVPDAVYQWGVGLSLLAGALYLLLRRGGAVAGAAAVRAACGVILLGAALFFLWPRAAGPEVEWTPFDDQALAQARAEGRPVIIDFYADWCLPCKELDARTFNEAGVVAESERFVRLKADLTSTGEPRVEQLTRDFRILGVPTIVFIDASGDEVSAARLTGFEGPQAFLARMQQVR
ncbi:MAG: cytochrome c biogenesis protein CcdA, partial [Thermoanaerobaculia bacterium]